MLLKPFVIPLIAFLLFSAAFCSAQDSPPLPPGLSSPRKSFEWDKVYAGGNVSLQFGTYTYIDISPLVGYKLTERLSVGTGVTYLYFRDNPANFSTNVYGGRLFSRFLILPPVFAHAEYELLNREIYDIYYRHKRINVTSLLVGGGYRQAIGDRSFLTLLLLWNLNDNIYSLYDTNPIVRVGFAIGL